MLEIFDMELLMLSLCSVVDAAYSATRRGFFMFSSLDEHVPPFIFFKIENDS